MGAAIVIVVVAWCFIGLVGCDGDGDTGGGPQTLEEYLADVPGVGESCEVKAEYIDTCIMDSYCEEEGAGSYYCEQCAPEGLDMSLLTCDCMESTFYDDLLDYCAGVGTESIDLSCNEARSNFELNALIYCGWLDTKPPPPPPALPVL
jgi:hypothetical protein